MQASQSALLQLYLLSFLSGCVLSFLYDLFYMLRLWLVPPQNRYTLPTVARIYAKRVQAGRKRGRGVAFRGFRFLGDVLFCLVSALVLILLQYGLNDGVFRASVPLCMAIGFALVRVSLARPFRVLLQYVAFGTEMLWHTLWAPFRFLYRHLKIACQQSITRHRIKKQAKQRKQYTYRQHMNIDKTASAILQISNATKNKEKKGAGRAKQSKKAV